MNRLLKSIQFLGWPVVCGLLVALVFLQNQQLQQLTLQSAEQPQLATPAPAPSFAEVISRASPSVVSINATSVNVESVERASEDSLNHYQ